MIGFGIFPPDSGVIKRSHLWNVLCGRHQGDKRSQPLGRFASLIPLDPQFYLSLPAVYFFVEVGVMLKYVFRYIESDRAHAK